MHLDRLLAGLILSLATITVEAAGPDAARVKELTGLLPAAPAGVGRPISDRAAWDTIARAREFRDVVADAEGLLKQPIPDAPDELYLEFSRTGNRTNYQRAHSARRSRLSRLVLAECLENRGRFLPSIEAMLASTAAEKAWTLPAHDRELRTFRGEMQDIDLTSSATSWELATIDYWLGDKLKADTRKLIRAELQRRTFQPYESYIATGKPAMWWPTTTNNWNAVCLAGVTGAALATIEPGERRAYYVAAAEHYIENFLKGFTPDGYCSEGMGYWNYGFGNYVSLAETVRQATGGRIDWLAQERIKPIATFGRRLEIVQGIYPAFADCHLGARPDTTLMAFLSRRLAWGLKETEERGLGAAVGPGSLAETGLYVFPNAATTARPAEAHDERPLRDWFADAGILICRPAKEGSLGAALKGGHNAEHHNHNDVGSYVVALGSATPLVDPGSEVYTARTFSSRRYESQLLNSFGHPVPRVAGQLQRTGRQAEARVVAQDFSDAADRLTLDLRSAYPVPELKKLERAFEFSRAGKGSLTVVDTVEFSQPQAFETALITLEKWRETSPGRLLIGEGSGAVEVAIDTAGAAFKVTAEEIREDRGRGGNPTRLGIALEKPVTKATVRLTIRPVE